MDNLTSIFTYPYDNDLLMRKQKKIKRMLLEREDISYIEKRIAILNGSTTDDIRNILELFLLQSGIKPSFYQSEYNKFYEDAVFGNAELDAFHPDVVIVFTSVVNLINKPQPMDSSHVLEEKLQSEIQRFQQIWKALQKRYGGVIIQNNMEMACDEPLGCLGAYAPYGMGWFVEELNREFAKYAASHRELYIHDMHRLSARVGLAKWHNRSQFYAYKLAMDYDFIPDVANGMSNIIKALFGKNKKCLVLDLDNTLWGGIIGDDGVEKLQLGHETPTAEAFLYFQNYVLNLKRRGVILAVASKNDADTAKSGFSHPDSVLKLEDFVSFRANWEPKNLNIQAIAEEIGIGIDSMVFLDDTLVERKLVRDSMPEVAVPEVDAGNVFSYIRAIEEAGYFEPVSLSSDDFGRHKAYIQNQKRKELSNVVCSYDEFLKSLEMVAEIDSFRPVYFERIAQLTNRSNQFNCTTCRYNTNDIERIANDNRYITLYGRLEDKFGDNGLVSVMIGEKKCNELHVRLWLMSCRVLKRGLENIMMDVLVEKAKLSGCKQILGYYYKSAKNKMVASLYEDLGFKLQEKRGDDTVWICDLNQYAKKNRYIKRKEGYVK